MFDGSVSPLVKDVLEGKNSLVFTYGVTNAGKTYTFLGRKNIYIFEMASDNFFWALVWIIGVYASCIQYSTFGVLIRQVGHN